MSSWWERRLDDAAGVENVDPIGGANTGEPVRDEQHGAAGEERANPGEELVLGPGVQGGRGLVEDHERSITEWKKARARAIRCH